jgi:hypothetical protein
MVAIKVPYIPGKDKDVPLLKAETGSNLPPV